MNSNWSYSPETHNSALNWWFFVQCDLEIWQMTLKSNRVPFLTYCKLCASFRSRWWIQSRVTVRKRPIQAKNAVFVPCNLEIKQMTSKTMWHFFSATSSDVHYFVAICESKLKLCSGKAHIEAIFALTPVTLTFDLWPWPFARTLRLSVVMTPENCDERYVLRKVWRTPNGQTDAQKCS